MRVIYEPKGRAKEYSELACNWYMGCIHGCKYCFAPGCMRKKMEDWHSAVSLRRDIISLFRKDAEEMRRNNDQRPILFSFLSDPYQPIEEKHKITRMILHIVQQYGLNSKILTKGSYSLIRRDFDLLKRAKTELGITVCFVDDNMRQEWEPNAAPVADRFRILKEAHEEGIYTWVSLEPVIDPEQALLVIKQAAPYVDYWKIGKLNHMKKIEQKIDWHQFHVDVVKLLNSLNAKYYIKEDLRKL